MPIFWTRHNDPPPWFERHGGVILAAILLIIEAIAAYQWSR